MYLIIQLELKKANCFIPDRCKNALNISCLNEKDGKLELRKEYTRFLKSYTKKLDRSLASLMKVVYIQNKLSYTINII